MALTLQDYFLNWTTSQKPAIQVAPYATNENSCSLTLYGQGAEQYGEKLQENMMRMLENFASPTAPAHSTVGQLWFDTANMKMKVFTGSAYVESSGVAKTQPSAPSDGDLWYDTTISSFKIYDGAATVWKIVNFGLLDGLTGNIQSQLNDLDVAITSLTASVQDPILTQFTSLNTSANTMMYFTAADTIALTALSAFARTLLGKADAVSARGTLGAAASGVNSDITELTANVTHGGINTFNTRTNQVGHLYLESISLEKITQHGNVQGAVNIDATVSMYHTATVIGPAVFTFTAPAVSGYASGFTLEIDNGGTAGVTWPTNVKWSGAIAPTLSATGKDLLVFTTSDAGVTWKGVVIEKDLK